MAEEENAHESVEEAASRGNVPPALPPNLPSTLPAKSQPESSRESLPELAPEGFWERSKAWFFEEGPWWLCSFVFHLVLVCSLALIGGKVVQQMTDQAPTFDEAKIDPQADVPEKIERFELGDTPEDPTELSTDTSTLEKPTQFAQDAEFNDESTHFEHKGGGMPSDSQQPNLGGLGGFDIKEIGAGPTVKGKGGVGVGVGTGTHAGSGGAGFGFGGRGSGSRKALLGSGGGTKQSEQAVAAALNWIARHQLSDGSWGLVRYKNRCKDATCTGSGSVGDRPAAATALALLPFFAFGQTHESKGPYQKIIASGVRFLISHQSSDGDLRMGGQMYDHGLATIALCECYGMTNDRNVRPAAQSALNFIMKAQDPRGGGWRYAPREEGDTSVVGWQIMALKSGRMAYLAVDEGVFEKAKAFLKSVSSDGDYGQVFTYMPGARAAESDNATTAIALLCYQYMGMPKTDPVMSEGTAYLMRNQPDNGAHNLYYWYYATQVMHNQPGREWDDWNRKMRRLLIDAQSRDGCATGSWSPNSGSRDRFGSEGGRLMATSLSALTLEVYYRYLPLYKLDRGSGGAAPAGKAPKLDAPKPASSDKPADDDDSET